MTHEAQVYAQEADSIFRPATRFYLACSCGYCGPIRRTQERARQDASAHVEAAAEAIANHEREE